MNSFLRKLIDINKNLYEIFKKITKEYYFRYFFLLKS